MVTLALLLLFYINLNIYNIQVNSVLIVLIPFVVGVIYDILILQVLVDILVYLRNSSKKATESNKEK